MKRSSLAAIFAGAVFAAFIAPGSAAAQDGSELRGAVMRVEMADGIVNTISFHPDGTATITSPSGLNVVQGRWSVANNLLCLMTGAGTRECWPYQGPFRQGQVVTLTSDCSATSRWLAESLAAPPVQEGVGQRGERG